MDAPTNSDEDSVRGRAHLAAFRTQDNAVAPGRHEWYNWWDTAMTFETTIIP